MLLEKELSTIWRVAKKSAGLTWLKRSLQLEPI